MNKLIAALLLASLAVPLGSTTANAAYWWPFSSG